jgi:hypothetical protein
LQKGYQYIYELPKEEIFIDHIQYNKLEDIGFYPNNLKIEASSRFAFLTYNEHDLEIIINVLICDPYYGDVQMALFQASKNKRFNSRAFFGKKYKDVMIKSIMY